jgi:regulator of cell morphogenesis and NO signaling
MRTGPTITPDMHVADIVTDNPATARVFEQHHIDYCCRGHRPLDTACADADIATADLLAELEGLDAHEVEEMPSHDIGALIGHIVATHHRFLRTELARLTELMDRVVAAHGDVHPEVHTVATLLSELGADLLPHLAEEEQVLFPLAIRLLGAVEPEEFHCGSVANPIGTMHAEHDRTGELLASLRRETDDFTPPADACPTWHALYAGLVDLEADTHRHVHLENYVLFPAIEDLERRLH